MLNKTKFLAGLVGCGVVLATACGSIAAETTVTGMDRSTNNSSSQFERIEQPVSRKLAVTLGGLGLIGLELWWFLFSKPRSRHAESKAGIQEVTITVDGGYEPSQIEVQAGQPVRLNFDRRDPSGCLEAVRFPDFHIAQDLPLNQVTPIEFTPDQPGKYEFTCGMKMFRGVVTVRQ